MNKEPELVDLGLPSGNLWMKCNLGATSDTDYGNYYQWGSLVGYQGEDALKHSSWGTSLFNNGENEFDEEYFKKNRHKWIYKSGILRPEFDVVTQTYGKGFKIPTDIDFYELLNNATIKTIKNYKNTKITGNLFISRINGNSIFIPFSGYVGGGLFHGVGNWCNLWSGRLHSNNLANYLFCCSPGEALSDYEHYNSFVIRGIRVKDE